MIGKEKKNQLKVDKKSSENVIDTKNLWKIYKSGKKESAVQTIALKDVSLNIKKGVFVAVVGASGSGKSTLLHLLAGLDRPTKKENQEIIINGKSLINRSENWLAKFRAENIGFVLQFFGLLPTLTALENVMMSVYFNGKKSKERRELAEVVLTDVGLEHRMNNYPNQLSGGELQRVAIARAIVNAPDIVFADEPTGNLDSKTGKEILNLLQELVKKKKITLILVTHDQRIYEYCDQVIILEDGEIAQIKHF